jgi:hypothetical protein
MAWLRLVHGPFCSPEELADAMQASLLAHLDGAADVLDGAVVFAFDAVYDRDGRLDAARTHYQVENAHVAALAARHPRVWFGASINPYRRDAIAALDEAVRLGAVLVKWLPPTQGIDPADPRIIPFYEALAHHGVPLLSHTGIEHTLPVLDQRLGDPARLEAALQRGVTVIMAHAGLPLWPWERSLVSDVRDLMRRYEHCYADTAALAVPPRAKGLRALFADPEIAPRLLHGSDWPITTIPHPGVLGARLAMRLWREGNPLRRDVRIKEELGAPPGYFTRAGAVLRLPARAATSLTA